MDASNVKTIEQQIRRQVDKKKHEVDGKITQVKGKAQEKLGELTHNDRMRRAGRRRQVVGKLQEKGSWLANSKTWLMLGTVVALVVAFIFLRDSLNGETAS